MKTTRYFDAIRLRHDRAVIREAWIAQPQHERVQTDGRIRRWARIEDAGGRWLRVVVLANGETVHNAFFDRDFEP
jgi:hypothetical protein